MVLWAIFGIELTGLVMLGVQRSWLIRVAAAVADAGR